MNPADDPALTAHAVDTLSAGEQARVEGLLAASPPARAALDHIEAQAEAVRRELKAAPKPPPPAPGDDLFAPEHRPTLAAVRKREEKKKKRALFWWWGAGAAVAAALAFFLFHTSAKKEAEPLAPLVKGQPGPDQAAPQSPSQAQTPAWPSQSSTSQATASPSASNAPAASAVAPHSFSSASLEDDASAPASSAGAAAASPPPFPERTAAPDPDADPAPPLGPTGPNERRLTPGPLRTVSESSSTGFSLPEFNSTSTAQPPEPGADGSVDEEGPGYQSADFGTAEANRRAPLPFTVRSQAATSPLDPARQIIIIALEPVDASQVERPPANLVFLVDDSISMGEPDRLPMFYQAFSHFLDRLLPNDRVALVVYAGDSALLLPSTPASNKQTILNAFGRLAAVATGRPGVSLQIAYDVARANFIPKGLNRVIAVTDGDLNLGVGETGGLYEYVSRHARAGISLSLLGVGREFGLGEKARKLIGFGSGRASATHSVAAIETALDREVAAPPPASVRDLKLQLTLAPDQTGIYRLLGYQNALPRVGSGLPAQLGKGVIAVFEVEGPPSAPSSKGPLEMKLQYRRAIPPDAPMETLTQKIGGASTPSFDEEIAGWQARLAALPHAAAPAPTQEPPASPMPSPHADAAGKVSPNAVSDFQKNAAGWIEAPPPKSDGPTN